MSALTTNSEERAVIIFTAKDGLSTFHLEATQYINPNILSDSSIDYITDKMNKMFGMFIENVNKYNYHNEINIWLITDKLSVGIHNYVEIMDIYQKKTGQTLFETMIKMYYDEI